MLIASAGLVCDTCDARIKPLPWHIGTLPIRMGWLRNGEPISLAMFKEAWSTRIVYHKETANANES